MSKLSRAIKLIGRTIEIDKYKNIQFKIEGVLFASYDDTVRNNIFVYHCTNEIFENKTKKFLFLSVTLKERNLHAYIKPPSRMRYKIIK